MEWNLVGGKKNLTDISRNTGYLFVYLMYPEIGYITGFYMLAVFYLSFITQHHLSKLCLPSIKDLLQVLQIINERMYE